MKRRVYLYGPVTGLTFDQAAGWRDWMIAELQPRGIEAVSPLRCERANHGTRVISGHGRDYPKVPLTTQRAIFARDKFDVMSCDMLVGNFLGATRIGVGSMYEQAWAHLLNKPIAVAVEPDGNPHDHMFFNESVDFRVESLEALRDVVLAVLT